MWAVSLNCHTGYGETVESLCTPKAVPSHNWQGFMGGEGGREGGGAFHHPYPY